MTQIQNTTSFGALNKTKMEKGRLLAFAVMIALLLTGGVAPVLQNFGIGGEVWAKELEEPDFDYEGARAALKELTNRVDTWESFSRMGRFDELRKEYDAFLSSAFTNEPMYAHMCPFQEDKDLEKFMYDNGIWEYTSEKQTCIQWYEHIKTLPIYTNDANVASTIDDLIVTFPQRVERVKQNFIMLEGKVQTEFPEVRCNDTDMTCAFYEHPFYSLNDQRSYVDDFIKSDYTKFAYPVNNITSCYAIYARIGLRVDPKFTGGVDMPLTQREKEIWGLFEKIHKMEGYAEYRAVYDAGFSSDYTEIGTLLTAALAAFYPMDELEGLDSVALYDKKVTLPMWHEWNAVFGAMSSVESMANGIKVESDTALFGSDLGNDTWAVRLNDKILRLETVLRLVEEDSLPVMMTRLSMRLHLYSKFWDFVNASNYIEVLENTETSEEYRDEVLNSLRGLLKECLSPETEGIDSMTADELTELVKFLPDYDAATVLVELRQKMEQEGLWLDDKKLVYFDAMPEDELLKEYTRVYAAMQALASEALAGLTDYSIKVGNTGANDETGLISAELVKGFVIVVVAVALIGGSSLAVKRRYFSPLKRR